MSDRIFQEIPDAAKTIYCHRLGTRVHWSTDGDNGHFARHCFGGDHGGVSCPMLAGSINGDEGVECIYPPKERPAGVEPLTDEDRYGVAPPMLKEWLDEIEAEITRRSDESGE